MKRRQVKNQVKSDFVVQRFKPALTLTTRASCVAGQADVRTTLSASDKNIEYVCIINYN